MDCLQPRLLNLRIFSKFPNSETKSRDASSALAENRWKNRFSRKAFFVTIRREKRKTDPSTSREVHRTVYGEFPWNNLAMIPKVVTLDSWPNFDFHSQRQRLRVCVLPDGILTRSRNRVFTKTQKLSWFERKRGANLWFLVSRIDGCWILFGKKEQVSTFKEGSKNVPIWNRCVECN